MVWDFCVGFHVDFDLDVRCRGWSDFSFVTRPHAEIGALRLRGSMERHARRLAGLDIGKRSVEGECQRHYLGHAVNGQRAVYRPGGSRHTADAATMVRHGREYLHIKVSGAAKVLVALADLRADAGGVDRDVDAAAGQVLRYGDGTRNLVESAAHQPDHMVTSAEVRETVVRIDLVRPRSGKRLDCRYLLDGLGGMIRSGSIDRRPRANGKE